MSGCGASYDGTVHVSSLYLSMCSTFKRNYGGIVSLIVIVISFLSTHSLKDGVKIYIKYLILNTVNQ